MARSLTQHRIDELGLPLGVVVFMQQVGRILLRQPLQMVGQGGLALEQGGVAILKVLEELQGGIQAGLSISKPLLKVFDGMLERQPIEPARQGVGGEIEQAAGAERV